MGRLSAREVYASTAFKRLRIAVIERSEGYCEWCEAKDIVRLGRDVHHLDMENHPYTIEKCVFLCIPCHQEAHGKRVAPKIHEDWKGMVDELEAG